MGDEIKGPRSFPSLTKIEKHLHSSLMIRDIVIGMSDGLTVPFALAAGMTGAVADTSIISTAGMVEIAGGSIAMGLGGYLAGTTEVEHYESEWERESEEVELYPDLEKQEVRELFSYYGLSENSLNLIVDSLASDKQKWIEFMMKFELGLDKPGLNRPRDSGLTIGLSYIIGGLIPLSPYFFLSNAITALCVSIFVTLCTLFILGFLKSKVTGQKNPFFGAVKVTLIGAIAATAAYSVARIFQNG